MKSSEGARRDPVEAQLEAYNRRAIDDFAPWFAEDVLVEDGLGAPIVRGREALRERYRQAWSHGLDGPVAWYRASPLRPPLRPDWPRPQARFAAKKSSVRCQASDADSAW